MRVLAVTTNASLVVALGSMMRDWEVVTVREVERATDEGSDSAVALIDLGETDAGIEAAGRLSTLGILIPCVVIGDKPVDDVRAQVLVRPFSLEDLGNAVREAATRPARPRTPAEPMLPTPPGNGNTRDAAATAPAREPEPEIELSSDRALEPRGLAAVPSEEPAAEEPIEPVEVDRPPEPEARGSPKRRRNPRLRGSRNRSRTRARGRPFPRHGPSRRNRKPFDPFSTNRSRRKRRAGPVADAQACGPPAPPPLKSRPTHR